VGTKKGLRDRAMIATSLGCAARPQSHDREVVPGGWWELEQIQLPLGHSSVQTTDNPLDQKIEILPPHFARPQHPPHSRADSA
jgi:hypothetical protein